MRLSAAVHGADLRNTAIALVGILAIDLAKHQMPIQLVSPSPVLAGKFLDFVGELARCGESFDGFGAKNLIGEAGMDDYLRQTARRAETRNLSPDRVRKSVHWAFDEAGNMVAVGNLRHGLTPLLQKHGGHVGYIVRPSQRGCGFGTMMLAKLIEKASEIGLQEILVTCDKDNLASRKVIENNRGILQDEIVSPVSNRIVCRYWILPVQIKSEQMASW